MSKYAYSRRDSSTQFVFGTDFDADTADAPSADVLEMLFHVLGALFRVEVARAVRRGRRPVNGAGRAGLLTDLAISAPVFDQGQFAFEGQVREDGGKADFTAVFRR